MILYPLFTTGIKLKALSEKHTHNNVHKYYFYGFVNCFMEQAHKSHRPQNIITKCTWHQLQEVLIWLTHILSRSYTLWEIGDTCISPFWMANHLLLTTAFIVGIVLGMRYTASHVAPSMTQRNMFLFLCLFLFWFSELTLPKTIHLLRNLCFCLIGPVFPVTLWFSKCLVGIRKGPPDENYIPNNIKMIFDFWAPAFSCVQWFSMGLHVVPQQTGCRSR